MDGKVIYSVIIPVYKNAPSLPEVVSALAEVGTQIHQRFGATLEVVFVVDGSPDDSFAILEQLLSAAPFRSQLLLHARNFGSFAAIRTGMAAAEGAYFGMLAADLQEPALLLVDFLGALLQGDCEIAVGAREGRADPLVSRFSANLFWRLYRAFVNPAIPKGGVDLFACNKQVRDELLKLDEAHSSLVALVYWLGFRRREVPYVRQARKYGKSAWTWRRKLDYLLNSVFAFTDLPIRLLTLVGLLGLVIAVGLGLVVLFAKLFGGIVVSGYATTLLVIVFFGALNTLGIGLVGHYAWRTYENTKRRPHAITQRRMSFKGGQVDKDSSP